MESVGRAFRVQLLGRTFFHNQYSSLYSWATIGNAYNGGQFTLRVRPDTAV